MAAKSQSALFLNPGRERSLEQFHPWVFSGAIARIEGNAPDGAFVEVFDSNGEFQALGHYSTEGSIAIRVLSWEREQSEQELLRLRLKQALALRERLGLMGSESTNAFRIVNSEGDRLSGLTIDWYCGTAVIQCHSTGMLRLREELVCLISELLGDRLKCIVDRSPNTRPEGADTEGQHGKLLWGTSLTTEILENDLKFRVDLCHGQKTGFYLDQRENRICFESYAKGRSVLNAFCYSGGFSLYALRAGACKVVSVDSSEACLELVKQNIAINGLAGESEMEPADCLAYLKSLPAKFDCIVLDPPAFVKHAGALRGGLVGYESVNFNAIRQILGGGVIFTFSCSQFLTLEQFKQVVARAAQRSGRSVRVLRELTQAACHPVSLFHPEGKYLKGLVLFVE